ncbi:actin-like ATPase domain-containing protein [Terfezia boudieri ATCC MYA-4762]|uniref:Actin-like ATPase domain-containing protein n=1 Tax=Terfezia boudieri ATCC MYA-4762 TaxID=1051890 RepID=A0A3N4LDA9_9PEZI|nr:actin-like ATPase domain-containing protein [Terfezia boudieri ATCC MYA-4762]
MPKKTKRKPASYKQRASNNAGPASNNVGPAGNNATSAPGKKPQQNTLIIGIDFGTTFSGVAWHNLASNKTHHNRDWPDQNQSSDKVPSVLRYSSKGIKWGYVPATPASKRLEWFKLLLNEGDYTTPTELLQRLKRKGLKGYPESKSTNLAQLRTTIKAIPAGKKPADLAADYLRSLYKFVQFRIGESFPVLKEQLGDEGAVEIKCCLTVPAIWDDKAKEITKKAAIDAGLSEKQIFMISEPEAAAVHCLTDLDEMKGNLKVGDVYVIADCGGGTVDLIPYEVTKISPLKVSECTIGTGGLCGSTVLNRRFEDLVISRIGQEAYDRMDDDDRQVMRKDFEMEIKPKFYPDKDHDDELDDELDDDNCVTCALPGVPDSDDSNIRVKKMRITIPNNELKKIFERTFTDITRLVQKQVNMAQEATKKNVNGIILVGGFGSSQYLADWLKDNVRNKDGKEIKLIRPPNPAVAIVLGAVKHGIHMHGAGKKSQWGIVESRRARYHYGISIIEPFKFGVHPRSKLAMDPIFGGPVCLDRMDWLIRKGALMREEIGITSEFTCRCPIVYSEEAQKALLVTEQEIYYSEEDTAPSDLEHPSVYPLLTYKTDFSDAQSRKHFIRARCVIGFREYWLIPAKILLKLESADLTFTTLVGGKVSGKGTKEYHHEDKQGVKLLQALVPGRVYELDDSGEGNQDEDVIVSELRHLGLGS